MTLLRTTARTLFASYFVASGLRSVRDPDPLVAEAEPLANKLVPALKQYAPASVGKVIPEDTVSLVRVNGATQLLGGLALASGKGRRLGAVLLAVSLVPSTLARHPFWQETTPEGKARERNQFLKNTSLLGGALVAAADTEGRPSLSWRASRGTKQLARGTKQLTAGGSSLAKDTRRSADAALAEGAVLVGALVKQSRSAKKRASKELDNAKKSAEKQAGAAAKRSREVGGDLQKRRQAAAAAKRSRDVKVDLQKRRQAAAEEAAKRAKVREKARAKRAAKAQKNIQRGEN